MSIMDMKSFLDGYQRDFADDVLRIRKPVKAEFGVTAIATHFARSNKYPVVLFENVITVKGKQSKFPVVINILGDRKKLAYAINSNFEDVGMDWYKKALTQRIQPVTVSKKEAPVKAHVILGDEINLFELPALRYFEMDPGPYITAGFFTCHDPETRTPNSALHRGFIAGRREIRVNMTAQTDAYRNLRAHEVANKEMKVAYWIGHHPAVMMGAQTKQDYRQSHYASAGGVAGQALRVVPSETLGDDFLVPADADFIIEGIIRPGRRALEGPFGEATKYTGPQVMSPVMEVSALTYREGAIWHAFTLGITVFFGWTQEEGALYTAVKRAVPEVLRVYIPESGCGRMIQYIQIKKTHEGQPRKAIFAAFSGCPYSKLIIVVDNDIDIYSDKDVLWALSSRSQWDRDLILVPNCFGQVLDPSSDDGFGTKAGIDATKPVDPHHFAVTSSVPIEAMEDAQLEKLIEPEILAKVPEHRKWR